MQASSKDSELITRVIETLRGKWTIQKCGTRNAK
jgi:hypothetical protein